MSKNTPYFRHDYGARNDPKMTKLRIKKGMAGIGAYWVLIEYFYEQGGELFLCDLESISDTLRVEFELLNSIIFDFGLFDNDGQKFFTNRGVRQLNFMEEKSEKAAKSVNKRWEKQKSENTNVSENNTNVRLFDTNKRKENNREENIKKEEREELAPCCFDDVFIFFKQAGWDIKKAGDEADNFLNHYGRTGWRTNNGPITNWKNAAAGWIKSDARLAEEKNNKGSPAKKKSTFPDTPDDVYFNDLNSELRDLCRRKWEAAGFKVKNEKNRWIWYSKEGIKITNHEA